MSIIALFPLALVTRSLSMKRGGRYDWEASQLVGHKVVPVTCRKASPNVHCGGSPLKFKCNTYADMGSIFKGGETVYINEAGEHVYPG